MPEIHKTIITDTQQNPLAVQIPYQEWLDIERLLNLSSGMKATTNLARHAGRLDWPVDGMEYQRHASSDRE